MNNGKVKELARDSGFVFWGDETHKPKGTLLGIDWSSDYDDALIMFAELVYNEGYNDGYGDGSYNDDI